jgi:hypothetical protein
MVPWRGTSATYASGTPLAVRSGETQMRKVSITAALVLMLSLLMPSCLNSHLYAQAPSQEPAVVSPKVNLTLEQRHVIKEFIKDMKTETAPAEVAPAVGDAIGQNVTLQPMPNELGQKVPQVKTHRFFIAGGQVFIVDPKDNKVVEVIKLAAD